MAEYEAYKDSGAVWIGKIPAEWTVTRLKNHLRRTDARNPGGVQVLSLYRELGIVPKDSRDDNHNVTSEDTSNYKYVQPGDFVVNKMKAWQGSVAVSDYEGIVSPAYYVYKFLDNSFHKRYFHYLIRSCYKEEFMSLSAGIRIGQWDLSSQDLDNVPVLIPTLTEQATIAEYLDRETERIDAIIAEAKASIEEYKAWKASIIYEAVTKGLDPNVEMKDSGIEWFGMIPQHWLSMKLRYALENISDVDHFMPESVSEGIPYIMTGDLEKMVSQINVEECKKISVEDYRKLSQKSKIQIDDVIFARYATIGTVSYVDVDLDCIISYSCVVVSPKKDVLSGKYLYYYLQSEAFASEVGKYINTNIQGNVGKESMYKAKILLPPITEQTIIVDHLDRKCQALDSLIAEKEALIKDMEAYKKSLIFEVVTGKRKV